MLKNTKRRKTTLRQASKDHSLLLFTLVFAVIGMALYGVSSAQTMKRKVTVNGQLTQQVQCIQAPCDPVPLATSIKGSLTQKRGWFMGGSKRWNFTTDEQGKFSLSIPKGTYTVSLPRKVTKKEMRAGLTNDNDQYKCDSQRFTVKRGVTAALSILCYPKNNSSTNPVAPPASDADVSLIVDSGKQFQLKVGQTATLNGSNITLKLNGVSTNMCGAVTKNDPKALCTAEYNPTVLFDLTVNGKTYTSTNLGQLPAEVSGYVKKLSPQDTDLKTYAKFTLYDQPRRAGY